MRYVLTCLHCGSRISATERVGDAEVEALLRADHPETLRAVAAQLRASPRAGLVREDAEVLGHVRVKMA